MRLAILDAATRLLATHGYEGTSLQAIADAVGIRKPSLVHHFPSKELLRQAVLEQQLAHWNDLLPKLLVAAAAGEGQFDAVAREIVTFFTADPDRARLLVREALDRPADMRERFQRHVVPVVQSLAKVIKAGRGKGVHPDLDAEAYLFQMVNLLITGVAFSHSFQDLMPETSRRGSALERLTQELLRIGKSSLIQQAPGLTPHPASAAPGAGKQRGGAARRA